MRLDELSDEELALRARSEPRAAFDALYRRHRGPLWNFLLRQGAGEERAEDLFQTTFLKAFRALPSFRKEARFKTWLYTIAVNALHDERRAAHRRGRTEPLREATLVTESRAHEGVERAEAVDRTKEALDGLAPDHRHLFTLVRFQGLTIAEAARTVGLSVPAAKMAILRTRKKIGELLSTVREKD